MDGITLSTKPEAASDGNLEKYSFKTFEVGKGPSLIPVCVNQQLNFSENPDVLNEETQDNSKFNDNINISATKALRKPKLQRLKSGLNSLTRHIEILSGKIIKREGLGSDSKRFKENDITSTITSKDETNVQNRNITGEYSLIETGLKKSFEDINNNLGDEESSRKHPNRRLQLERIECDISAKRARQDYQMAEVRNTENVESLAVPAVKRETRVFRRFMLPGKRLRRIMCGGPSKSVEDVLPKMEKVSVSPNGETNTTEGISSQEEKQIKVDQEVRSEKPKRGYNLWGSALQSQNQTVEKLIGEPKNVKEKKTSSDKKNYELMLYDFVSTRDYLYGNCETVYERRVEEMLADPNWSQLLREFYIPPALVEVFRCQTKPNETAENCVKKICELKRWPEPTFACQSSGVAGFLCSCILKSRKFVPAKPTWNEALARELAATECLQWLGLYPRPAPSCGTGMWRR